VSKEVLIPLEFLVLPLAEVLASLQTCPSKHRPFVIVQDEVTGRFVQYASGAKDGLLVFDVPARSSEYPLCPNRLDGSIERRSRDVVELAKWGQEVLGGPLALPYSAMLRVRFETSEPGKDG
jgi:hypothetical protein